MDSNIASREEVILRMDALKETQKFFAESEIKEHSKVGQQMSELQDRIINRILSDNRIQIVSK